MYLPVGPDDGLIEQFAGYFALTDADIAVLRDPSAHSSMQALLGIDGMRRNAGI